MGTSQSSNGSPSGVPMVPSWVPEIPLTPPTVNPIIPNPEEVGEPARHPIESARPIPLAPAARFGSARRNLGEFARTGDRENMRRGVGQYIQKGYGGSGLATRRFGGTTQTANALYLALGGGGAENPFAAPGNQLDPQLLRGRSADEIMDAVVEAIRPVDGTQDSEASRAAIKEALAQVLTRFPDADLLNMEDQHREMAIERYVAEDVFRRFDLDVGKAVRDKAPNAAAGLGRLKEIRDYIRETVAASFRRLNTSGQQIGAGRITQIVQNALREAFQVFEGYAE